MLSLLNCIFRTCKMRVVGTNSKWEQDAQFNKVRGGAISKERSNKRVKDAPKGRLHRQQ